MPSADEIARAAEAAAVQAHQGVSSYQRIAQLEIKGRIQLALRSTREERAILIRDSTKLVALAVLDCPKLSDTEVEQFAAQRNVTEAVLRGIFGKRRFLKQYPVVRNLVFNPRTPLDISLTLIKHLLIADLRHLAASHEVDDTLRRLAAKMFRTKMEANRVRG